MDGVPKSPIIIVLLKKYRVSGPAAIVHPGTHSGDDILLGRALEICIGLGRHLVIYATMQLTALPIPMPSYWPRSADALSVYPYWLCCKDGRGQEVVRTMTRTQ